MREPSANKKYGWFRPNRAENWSVLHLVLGSKVATGRDAVSREDIPQGPIVELGSEFEGEDGGETHDMGPFTQLTATQASEAPDEGPETSPIGGSFE